MIFRARIVVTMDGPPIENGAVAIDGRQIVDVGSFANVKARQSDEVVDLGEQILLPGLINAHCHLDYTCFRGKIAPKESFTDWIRAINAEKSKLSDDDYLASISAGFSEAKNFGTTSLINLEAFPHLIARIATPPLRTWWCAELIDVRFSEKAPEIVECAMRLLRSAVTPDHAIGLAPHAPFTASADLYRRCDQIARRENILLTTHLAESREEREMFCDGSGSLFDFMKAIGRSIKYERLTPLEYLSAQVQLDECWIVAHANELTSGDFERLRNRPKFNVVHCPRSHRYFKHGPFPSQKLRSLGFNICLGTDSLASNSSLSLFDEMRAMQGSHPSLSPSEIIEMTTVNPARALRCSDRLGQLRAGFFADLIAVPGTGSTTESLERVIAFEKPISWIMVDGKFAAPSTT